MAQYNYKGYIAEVTEEILRDEWFTFLPEPTHYRVKLISEFESYISKPCLAGEAKVLRNMYIKYFERQVDKHLSHFK